MVKELYLEDSYLRNCDSSIIEINNNQVVLDQTIFYPEGGGQPSDTGAFIQNNITYKVKKVKKEKGKIIHYIEGNQLDTLEIGPITCILDWDKRYNVMRYHTLLHIIGSYFYKEYNALCSGNQIYEDRARIDFNGIGILPEDKLKAIETKVNDLIQGNHSVYATYLDREEAEEKSDLIKTMINLLPKSIKNIRVVTIGDIDEQACGGTHVKNTSEVNRFSIVKVKNKGKDNKRLEVVLL
jgi:misacylated tRNA(Ala) deacylase